MTTPIHTTQHVQSLYRKYQVMAVVFTAITLIAAILAVLSGFQLSKLEKRQKELVTVAPPAPTEPEPIAQAPEVPKPDINVLNQKIADLEGQLTKERKTTQKLKVKIQELEQELSIAKSAPIAKPPSSPLKQSQSLEQQTKETPPSAKPKVVEPIKPAQPSKPTGEPSVTEPTQMGTTPPPSHEPTPKPEKTNGIQNPAPIKQKETPPSAAPIQPEPSSVSSGAEEPPVIDVPDKELQVSPKEPIEKKVTEPEKPSLKDDTVAAPSKNEKPEAVTTPRQNQNGKNESGDLKKNGAQNQQ